MVEVGFCSFNINRKGQRKSPIPTWHLWVKPTRGVSVYVSPQPGHQQPDGALPQHTVTRMLRSPLSASPLLLSTLCHLVTAAPPFSPSPGSRAALGTKGILHSAGVWKTGLFHKGIYVAWVGRIVSRMQLGNLKPPPRWGRWDIFSKMSQWSLRYCVSHMAHEHVPEWTAVGKWLVPSRPTAIQMIFNPFSLSLLNSCAFTDKMRNPGNTAL